MEACPVQVLFLKNLLQDFASSTGLKVNFAKSMLVPINVQEDTTTHLAQLFGCVVGSLPFTYLGLPLGLTKPKVIEFMPLVTRCERRLSFTSPFLSQAGRLEVTNSIFTSFPMFFMSTFRMHKTVIKQIDAFRKHCLWRGADVQDRKPAKAAWELTCLPKNEGGLGVLNLQTQNDALMLKNLHKFFNRVDIPWVHLVWERHYNDGTLPSSSRLKGSFWWKDNLKLLDSFKGMAMVNIVDGQSCLLWDDLWFNKVPRLQYPQLFSFAKLSGISINAAVNSEGPNTLFHLPLSQLAAVQLMELAHNLNSLQLQNDVDIWTYIWGSPIFSTSKAYKHLTGHRPCRPFFRKIWKTSCQNKHKVFFWLLLIDRLSTRQLLRRRNMFLPSYSCVCCFFKYGRVSSTSVFHLSFCPIMLVDVKYCHNRGKTFASSSRSTSST